MWRMPTTIHEMLKRNVTDYPNREAIVSESYITGKWHRHTWKELDEITNHLAAGLYNLGVKSGDKIAFMQNNCIENIYTYLAVHKIGAVFVPVNVRLVSREVEFIVNNSNAQYLIAGSKFIALTEKIRESNSRLKHIIFMGTADESIPAWALSFDNLSEKAGSFPGASISQDDDADLIYTSGTTGLPKGVLLTQANKVANGRLFSATTNSYRSLYVCNKLQTSFPFFTSAFLSTMMMRWLYCGFTMIFETMFDAKKVLELIQREKTTEYAAAPTMLMFILDHPQVSEYDTSSLCSIIYGGSAMPEEIIRKIFQKWENVVTYNVYGSTEAGPGGTFLRMEKSNISKNGSIGVPWLPDQEVRIVDDNLQDMGVGEVGEIVIKGPNIMKGYHDNPKATLETLRDGWLCTGDMGYYDKEGYFYYTDRKKDMIVRGGFNVYPVEVENVLFEHPDVFQCAVIGKPHPKLGEDVVAIIVPREGITLTQEEILAFCSDKLADYKRPREIIFTDQLILTAMGKMNKKEMRKMYFSA